jgi:hypothetical protein
MRKVLWLCAATAAMLLGAFASFGAASSHSSMSVHPGRLVGGIVFSGRVPRSAGKSRYHRGWVEVGQHGHLVAKQWVKTNHRYHFTLAPGTYDVAGYTRYGVCRNSATIHSSHTTHVNVGCVWH